MKICSCLFDRLVSSFSWPLESQIVFISVTDDLLLERRTGGSPSNITSTRNALAGPACSRARFIPSISHSRPARRLQPPNR